MHTTLALFKTYPGVEEGELSFSTLCMVLYLAVEELADKETAKVAWTPALLASNLFDTIDP